MKYRLFYPIVAFIVLCSFFTSCTKDDFGPDDYNTQIFNEGNYKILQFRIPYILESLERREGDLRMVLTGINGNDGVIDLSAAISKIAKNRSEIKVKLSAFDSIPDGQYILSFFLENWQARESFMAEFRNQQPRMVSAQEDFYSKLKYNDAVSAYEINSETDFKVFLEAITKDSNYGSGRKFLQTADLDWDAMKNSLSVGLEKRVKFAGTYDGGSYSINKISYSGASNDNDVEVGLFKSLLNGACVKSLSINCNQLFSNIKEKGGMLAGSASGVVNVENISITGGFNETRSQNSKMIGGLIGYVNNATISVTNVELDMSMQYLGEDIGGIIGRLENSTATISGIKTPNYEMDIYARKNVGGIIGLVINSSFNIHKSELNHATTQQTGEMYKIELLESNAGGVVGCISSLSGSSTINSMNVRIPVGAKSDDDTLVLKNVGGLVGYAKLTHELAIENVLVSSSVGGKENVGGFIGYCELSGNDYLKFSGLNVISPQKKSYVAVKGVNSTGGFIGKLEANGNLLTFGGETRLYSNVYGEGDYIGGYIGYMSGGNISLENKVTTELDSMSNITSTGNYIGGFCGYAIKSTVKAGNKDFGFGSSIPKFSEFTSNVICTVMGQNYVGGGFGYVSECKISNMAVKATVTGNEYTGGIFGYVHFHNDVEINRCVHDGIVTATANNTGGVAGYIRNNGKLQYCINYGKVTGKDNVGGIVGKIDYFEQPPYTHYCVNTGDVSGTGDVGGVAGFMDGQQDCSSWTSVKNCANYGSVTSSGGGDNGVGGIIGRCKQRHGKIISCANHGDISGSAQQAGGIVGWMGNDPGGVYQSENLEIGYCANFGNVNSTHSNAYVGGISGYNEEGCEGAYGHSHLHACYNCGNILSDPEEDTGGLLGYADHYSATEDCINFGKVEHGNAGVGTRKALAIIDVVNVYYLKGSGKDWKLDSDKEFTESQMSDMGNFSKLKSSYWQLGTSVYSKTVNNRQHPVLKECPFQNIEWK